LEIDRKTGVMAKKPFLGTLCDDVIVVNSFELLPAVFALQGPFEF
jgi:hypothetical protein